MTLRPLSLSLLKVPQLVACLAANGIDATALNVASNSIDMAHLVADGLLNGLAQVRRKGTCCLSPCAARPRGTAFPSSPRARPSPLSAERSRSRSP